VPVGGVHGGGDHADEHLVVGGHRLVDLAELEGVG
jgi:hypothetical protein